MAEAPIIEVIIPYGIHFENDHTEIICRCGTQSRIIGAVRGAHSQLWGTIIPVCSLYSARKYDRRFGTPALSD